MSDILPHSPVLYHEIITVLQPKSGGLYADCTLGAGGHAWGILNASSPEGQLLGLDVDPQAIELARNRLSQFCSRVFIVRASYVTLADELSRLGWKGVDGVLLDLGVSSMQLDSPGRGFSFKVSEPLDMRFNPADTVSAADLVNSLSENELADLIYRYGEERMSRQIARAIVQSRPVLTTDQLAEVVSRSVRRGQKPVAHRSRSDPATRTFQALRIAVNHELEALSQVLPIAIRGLAPGGRLAVISFHSLEDRLVKQFFRRESQDCICPPRQPVCTCGHRATLREITPRPIRPQPFEVRQNPRSRSARLRVAERLGQ